MLSSPIAQIVWENCKIRHSETYYLLKLCEQLELDVTYFNLKGKRNCDSPVVVS